jgi:hypothetical protein
MPKETPEKKTAGNKALELGQLLAERINNLLSIKNVDKQLLLFEDMQDFIAQNKKETRDYDETLDAFALLCFGKMPHIQAYKLTHPNSKTKNKRTLYVAASKLYNSPNIQLRLSDLETKAKKANAFSPDEINARLRKELDHDDANIRLRAIRLAGEGIGYFKWVQEGKLHVTADAGLSELDKFIGQKANGGENQAYADSDKK